MKIIRSTFLCLGLLQSIAAEAFVKPTSPEPTESLLRPTRQIVIRPILTAASSEPTLTTKFGDDILVSYDRSSQAIRLLSGGTFAGIDELDALAPIETFVRAATDYVDLRPEVFGVSSKDLVLVRDATLHDVDDQFLSFRVTRHGIPIEDAGISFRFKKGRLLQIVNESFAEASSDVRSDALDLKSRWLQQHSVAKVRNLGPAFRVHVADGGYQLVRVQNLLGGSAGDELSFQIEAATGQLWQAIPSRHYESPGRAEALTYSRTYFQESPELYPLPLLSLTSAGTAIETAGDGTFVATSAPTMAGFRGRTANVVPTTGTLVRETASQQSGNWLLSVGRTDQKDMAQANVYRHLIEIGAKAKRHITASWLNQPLRANVNLSSTCNAYWDGSTVNFYSAGGNCGNTALIADVVYHEWGHGLDANTGGIEDGAYSEGFGDIVSMLMTRDPILAPGFRSSGAGIRDLAPDKVFPRDQGEVHAEGLIIGGTFWDLFKALETKYDTERANELVSKFAFKTIFTARRYTNVYDALLVVDDDDGNLANKTPNFCEINRAFTAHGLAQRDQSCL